MIDTRLIIYKFRKVSGKISNLFRAIKVSWTKSISGNRVSYLIKKKKKKKEKVENGQEYNEISLIKGADSFYKRNAFTEL